MVTTTSNEKTYSFYLEVNSNNYKEICSSIPYTLQYKSSNCNNTSSATLTEDISTINSKLNTFYTSSPSCKNSSGYSNYTYNLYKPLNYSNKPSYNLQNEYVPPSTPMNAGFYNTIPFIATVTLLNNLNPPSSTSFTTFAVYEILYNIDYFNQIKNDQLLDFFNLQTYLQTTFSSWFKDQYQNQNILSMKQLLMDYCNETSSMVNSVCSSVTIPLLGNSPCIDPYSNCSEGWGTFCSQIENYNSSNCQDYYKNSYYNNNLDNSIQNNLKSICSELYESNPSVLSSEEYLNTCACFLPQDVYKEFPSDINSENQENWYYPCYRSPIKQNLLQPSPTTQVISCMNEKYKNSTSTQDITNQTYQECYKQEFTTQPTEDENQPTVYKTQPTEDENQPTVYKTQPTEDENQITEDENQITEDENQITEDENPVIVQFVPFRKKRIKFSVRKENKMKYLYIGLVGFGCIILIFFIGYNIKIIIEKNNESSTIKKPITNTQGQHNLPPQT